MKKAFIISIIITALQFIAAAVLFFYLPGKIPIHWNVSGVVDGFAGRAFIFLVPALSLVIAFLLNWMPQIAPKGENVKKSGRIYPVLMVMISLLMAVILTIIAATALGHSVPVIQISLGWLGVMMLLIGNYLPKVKPNYMLGIRLPWTLANETVWRKTHRFGGWVFFVIGLVFIGGMFLFAPVNYILPFAGLFVGLLAIVGVAYMSYEKNK